MNGVAPEILKLDEESFDHLAVEVSGALGERDKGRGRQKGKRQLRDTVIEPL